MLGRGQGVESKGVVLGGGKAWGWGRGGKGEGVFRIGGWGELPTLFS